MRGLVPFRENKRAQPTSYLDENFRTLFKNTQLEERVSALIDLVQLRNTRRVPSGKTLLLEAEFRYQLAV